MAVRIRMKQMGRTHRHYYRIVAIDHRQPRDGRAIEELGTYDPHVRDHEKSVTLRPSTFFPIVPCQDELSIKA